MGIVYQAESPSGKRYIGVTSKTLTERWKQHAADAQCGQQRAIHHAIRKYGKDAFKLTVLAEGEMSEMFLLERKAIQLHRTLVPHGYNMACGGEGASNILRNPCVRQKQGRTMKTVWERPGYRQRVGGRIAARKTGQLISEAHRQALSNAAKRRWSRGVPDSHREMARVNANKRWSHGE